MLECIYWLCIVIAIYPYLGYPILAFLAARCCRWPNLAGASEPRPVSVVIAAHNEAQQIGRRVRELAHLASAAHPQSEVIVVSDGSTDATTQIIRAASAT